MIALMASSVGVMRCTVRSDAGPVVPPQGDPLLPPWGDGDASAGIATGNQET